MLFIIYQTSRTRQTSQTPDTCPLKPETCPLIPNIGAKIIKNIFISYFFNLFYISSFVTRHSSLVIRNSPLVISLHPFYIFRSCFLFILLFIKLLHF